MLLAERYDIEEIDVNAVALTPVTPEIQCERSAGKVAEHIVAMARRIAAADRIVVAAPFWDMSFPSLLKLYIEHLCVNRLTFSYDATGRPRGLVNVKKVVYITTSGGFIGSANFGFDYIKALFSTLFTIPDIAFISAEGLDLYGNNPEAILTAAINKID